MTEAKIKTNYIMKAISSPLHLIHREEYFHQVYKRDGAGNITHINSKITTINWLFLGINIFQKVTTDRTVTIKILGIFNTKIVRTGIVETISSERSCETVTRKDAYSKTFLSIPLSSSISISVFEELKQDCKTWHIPP